SPVSHRARRSQSPDHMQAQDVAEYGISSYQRQRLDLRLRCQHAIEGMAMRTGKETGNLRMSDRDRQGRVVVGLQQIVKHRSDWGGLRPLAPGRFRCDFPSRYSADDDLGLGQCLAKTLRQSGATGKK